jgi:hypothetical protein
MGKPWNHGGFHLQRRIFEHKLKEDPRCKLLFGQADVANPGEECLHSNVWGSTHIYIIMCVCVEICFQSKIKGPDNPTSQVLPIIRKSG